MFRLFATFTSLDIISSFFSNFIFSVGLFFLERNYFTVCQNFLLSVIWFSFKFVKYCFLTFMRIDTQKVICLAEVYLFSYVGFFKNLFLKPGLFILVIKGFLFLRMYFFFLEHDDLTHSGIY